MSQLVGEVLFGLEVVVNVLHCCVFDREEKGGFATLDIFCDLVDVKDEAVLGAHGGNSSFDHGAPLGRKVVEVFFGHDFRSLSRS